MAVVRAEAWVGEVDQDQVTGLATAVGLAESVVGLVVAVRNPTTVWEAKAAGRSVAEETAAVPLVE